MNELFDSKSDPIAAGAAYRAAGYPEELIDWLAAPDPRHDEFYRGWRDTAVKARLGLTGELAAEFDQAADRQASAGLDSAGDPDYHIGFHLGNWASDTGRSMLIDTANLEFIKWLTSRLPASELPSSSTDPS